MLELLLFYSVLCILVNFLCLQRLEFSWQPLLCYHEHWGPGEALLPGRGHRQRPHLVAMRRALSELQQGIIGSMVHATRSLSIITPFLVTPKPSGYGVHVITEFCAYLAPKCYSFIRSKAIFILLVASMLLLEF
jgi:hypothetical protein